MTTVKLTLEHGAYGQRQRVQVELQVGSQVWLTKARKFRPGYAIRRGLVQRVTPTGQFTVGQMTGSDEPASEYNRAPVRFKPDAYGGGCSMIGGDRWDPDWRVTCEEEVNRLRAEQRRDDARVDASIAIRDALGRLDKATGRMREHDLGEEREEEVRKACADIIAVLDALKGGA